MCLPYHGASHHGTVHCCLPDHNACHTTLPAIPCYLPYQTACRTPLLAINACLPYCIAGHDLIPALIVPRVLCHTSVAYHTTSRSHHNPRAKPYLDMSMFPYNVLPAIGPAGLPMQRQFGQHLPRLAVCHTMLLPATIHCIAIHMPCHTHTHGLAIPIPIVHTHNTLLVVHTHTLLPSIPHCLAITLLLAILLCACRT